MFVYSVYALFMLFGFLAPQNYQNIVILLNFLTLSKPDEDYYTNWTCALDKLITTLGPPKYLCVFGTNMYLIDENILCVIGGQSPTKHMN